MQFTVNKKLLAQVVSFAKMMVSGRSTLPILNNICFSSIDNQFLCVTATNLTKFVRLCIVADINDFGSVAIPANMLSELMASLPDEQITVNASNRTHLTEIKCGRHKSTLKGVDPADMPAFPELGNLPSVEIAPSLLLDMIAGVVDCASDDDARIALATVKMSQNDGRLQLAATDGYRLGLTNAPATPYSVDALLPSDSIVALSKLLPQAGSVKLATNDRHAIFHLDCQGDILEILFASTLVNSNYPDYMRIVPQNHTVEVVVAVEPMIKALKLAKFFASDNGRPVAMSFKPENADEKSFVLISTSGQDGDYSARVLADVSFPLDVRLSSEFLLDTLTTCPTEKVTITGTTPLRPLSFRPCGKKESEWYHLLMPMQRN